MSQFGQIMQSIGDNDGKWEENFDFHLWMERYAPKLQKAGVEEHEAEHGFTESSWEWKRTITCVPYQGALRSKQALCCPEDVRRHPSRSITMSTPYASTVQYPCAWSVGLVSTAAAVSRFQQR